VGVRPREYGASNRGDREPASENKRRINMTMIPIMAAAAAQTNAIKASGLIVSVTPSDFERILKRIENPLVIAALGGFWKKEYQYLTSYRGFAFFTKSNSFLSLLKGRRSSQPGRYGCPYETIRPATPQLAGCGKTDLCTKTRRHKAAADQGVPHSTLFVVPSVFVARGSFSASCQALMKGSPRSLNR
jgi:hypothetical protein